jgi:hypothetical protein
MVRRSGSRTERGGRPSCARGMSCSAQRESSSSRSNQKTNCQVHHSLLKTEKHPDGFVRSREDINDAVRVASTVGGVKSVTNEMQLK